jgi:hypothetical protein
MLADEIDHRHLSSRGIVQIGETICEAGSEMQKGTSRLFSHASIAIGGSGHDAFEETERATDLWYVIQRGDDMNFRGARICEAGINATRDE